MQENLYTAIDVVYDKLSKQLKNIKRDYKINIKTTRV